MSNSNRTNQWGKNHKYYDFTIMVQKVYIGLQKVYIRKKILLFNILVETDTFYSGSFNE